MHKVSLSLVSTNIIYFIMCRKCGLQYVGETCQPLHLRVNGHRYDITHRRTDESPVAEHFRTGTHTESDMAVMAIDLVLSCDACLRKIRESRWIRTLGTSSPSGMNLRVGSLWTYFLLNTFGCFRARTIVISRLCHPMKTIKIWIKYLNVECANNIYEFNHCITLFVCVLDKDSLLVETSHTRMTYLVWFDYSGFSIIRTAWYH